MVDYWVSKERHYCKFCNVWMQGDKMAVKHHEQGKKHKEKVEEILKQKRKAKSEAYHSEKDLQEQLREIEEAAQARHAQDLAASGAPPPPPPRRPGQAPPPPPRRPGDFNKKAYGSRRPDDRNAPEQEEEQEKEESKEDDYGVYMTHGEVFLEGKRHELITTVMVRFSCKQEKLESGSACQVWVEEIEEWLNALIENVVVHMIPNTDLSFRKFTITYMVPGQPQPITEKEVRSDRLRIKMPAGVTLEAAQHMMRQMQTGEDMSTAEEAAVIQAPVAIDEETGMGEWSTVVVHEIDESEEAVAKREAEAQAEAERLAEEEKRREALEDFSSQGDNALGAFNPWGGSYKGVQLEKASSESKRAKREEEIKITTKGDVGFKKRKKANGGEKKQKRIRASGDDD